MGNSLATFMLFVWPLVVVMLFRSYPIAKALAISVIGGYLVLPVSPQFNLPLLPSYDKTTAAVLPALLMAVLATRRQKTGQTGQMGQTGAVAWQAGWLPQTKLFKICFITIFVAGILTVLTNGDSIVYPLRTLQGLRPYGAASLTLTTLTMLLPFLMARKFLARPEDQAAFLAVFAVAAILYSLPTLWEVRMSPRLNAQIYGFFPHDWRQHLRAGGYRPLVFLEHGLRLGLFLALGVLATAVLLRTSQDQPRRLAIFGLAWLLPVLVLSKNLTAFLIVCLLLPAVMFLRPRGQVLIAAIFAGTVLLYPMTRAVGLVPIDTITSTLSNFAEASRISSLNFRLANEDILLEKANQRPLFGWGGWARARVFDEQGRDVSVPDGAWIIEFGEKGWIGYLTRFGLLTLPIIVLAFRRHREAIPPVTSGLAILLAGNLLDLLPNSGLTLLTWMMAGSLVGFLERKTETAVEQPTTPGPHRARSPYQRPPQGPQAQTARSPQARSSRTQKDQKTRLSPSVVRRSRPSREPPV